MAAWELPEAAALAHGTYAIRSDFRAVLDVIAVMSDPDIGEQERGYVAMSIFYPGLGDMDPRDREAAAEFMTRFVDGGEARGRKGPQPRLMDWEQDFPLIIAPVNRVLGYEARAAEHVHWWTFLGAYMEIGECLFANVVSNRRKRAQGKMDKSDREFYRRNRDLVDFRRRPVPAEDEAMLERWIG